MLTLGIDTSNYATSLAVFDSAAGEVVCALKRFLPVKPGELGLRQSDAVFHHTAALPELLRELEQSVPLTQIGAVGVSEKPRPVEGSYMPCFLTGIGVAQAVAQARGVPLVHTSHQQGHIMAALFATGDRTLLAQPVLVFHISGGTTELLLTEDGTVQKIVGQSTDLYAGQAVDRVGVTLGFPFPAGASLSALAAQCTQAVKPAPKLCVRGTDCSLSGLENQCAKLLQQGREPAYVAKFCLEAVGGTVLGMIEGARKTYPQAPVVCAGGVMSSEIICGMVQNTMPQVYFVPPQYASDNAIGVAVLAAKQVNAWPM